MSRATQRLAERLKRVFRRPVPATVVTLSLQPELGLLRAVASLAELTAPDLPHPGAVFRLVASETIPETVMMPWLADRTGGEGAPGWHAGAGGAPVFGAHIGRVSAAWHIPAYGAVVTDSGAVLHSTVAEALYVTPTLAGLPGAAAQDAGDAAIEAVVQLTLDGDAPRLASASVFMPWGANFNYGHFLLDALPALAALDEAGLLHSHPPVAPSLTAWQRELLALYFGRPRPPVRELDADAVAVHDVVFASPMDHFLHAPNRLLGTVRSRILSHLEAPPTTARRVYLSRRNDEKRRLLNEAELEAALVARGFTVVHPQQHSVAEQIAFLRDADVVVAPTGAALANTLFCSPGAKVFEIQPTNFVGIWVRAVCFQIGAEWYGFFAPSPESETMLTIEDQPRPGLLFDWRLKLDDFLAFLDQRL